MHTFTTSRWCLSLFLLGRALSRKTAFFKNLLSQKSISIGINKKKGTEEYPILRKEVVKLIYDAKVRNCI